MIRWKRVCLRCFVGLASLLLLMAGCEKSSEEMYKKGVRLYEAGKYQQAVELFETLLARYPDHSLSVKARYQLGNIYLYQLNNPEKSLQYAQQLYEESPQGKYAMHALQLIGSIYEKSLNRCLDGAEAYRLLLRDYAADIDAGKYQMTIAECYFKLREYPQAITEYTRVFEQYPQSTHVPRARFQMANSYALLEQYDRAVAIYEELLHDPQTLSPQFNADIKLELAYCYGQQEEYQKAVALYEELERLQSSEITLDADLIARKKERTLQRLAELHREPEKVEWKRR